MAPLLDELLADPTGPRTEAARILARLACRMEASGRKDACPFWRTLSADWRDWRLTRNFALSVAAVANAAGVAVLGEPEDFVDFAALSGRLGPEEHAALLQERIRPMDVEPGQPRSSFLFRALAARSLVENLRTVLPAAQAAEVADACGRAAIWFLRAAPADEVGAPIFPVTEMTAIADAGMDEWRRHYWDALAHPWTAAADAFARAAVESGDTWLGQEATWLLSLVRRHAEDDERAAVAQRIRSWIDASGLSQRDFARLIGTSPSRLSTYASGKTVPAATLMVRMSRAARRAAEIS